MIDSLIISSRLAPMTSGCKTLAPALLEQRLKCFLRDLFLEELTSKPSWENHGEVNDLHCVLLTTIEL